jgi:ABC-2 type transport system permease protein
MSGLVVWSLVNTTLVTSVQSITVNSNLVGKVNFPRAVLPLATLGSALVHFCLQFTTFLGLLLVVGHHIDVAYVWLVPLAIVAVSLFLASLALVLSIANVHARDTQHLLELAMIAFFWALPIIYEYMRVGRWLKLHHIPTWLPLLNPITSIIITFQRALYGSAFVGTRQLLPAGSTWWYLRNIGIIAAVSVCLLALALRFFDRNEGNLAEML